MRSKQKVLITGGGGMLAEAVLAVFSRHQKYELTVTGRQGGETGLIEMDVGRISQVEEVMLKTKPDVVVHLAALTDLEYCQSHEADCLRVNALGTENVAMMAKKLGATMVYISTAAVFDGTKESYSEFDCPHPINIYGQSKYLGEQFVQQHLDKYFIFRSGWMIGGGVKKDKKFVNKIYSLIKGGKKELMIVSDKFGSVTYTYDLAKTILRFLDSGYFGLYHSVCGDVCSRYEIALRLVELLGVNVQVTGVKSSYFEKEYSTQRPTFEVLTNTKAELRGIDFSRSWKECLDEYVGEFKADLGKV